MSRLIWVFAGQSYVILLVLLCSSLFLFFFTNIVIYYSETEEARWKLYTDTEKIFPRSSAPKRIPLNFTTGTYWSFSQNLKGCARLLGRVCIRRVFRRSWVRSSSLAEHSFVAVGHEIITTAILSLLLVQAGQLSVTGKRMCTKYYWLTD